MKKNTPSKIRNPQSLRVLIVEDLEDDVLLEIRELKKGGYNPVYERVETASAMKKALKEKQWDIILCDYKMPKFNAPSAIAVLKDANIDIPLIIVSGTIGEDVAVECMRLGAQDYIMKGNISRLCPAIARELEDAKVRNKQRQAESQREAALEELRKSEESFRAVAENAYDGMIIAESMGIHIFANKRASEITGYSVEELLKMRMKELAYPDEIQKLSEILKNRMSGKEVPRQYETAIVHKEGTKVQIEVTGTKTFWHGQIADIVIFRDITKRKRADEALRESEQRLASIYNTVGDVIFHLAVEPAGQFRFVSVNSAFLKVTGLSPEIVVGRTVNEIIPEPSLTMVLGKYRQAIAENTIVSWEELSDYPTGRLSGLVSIAPVFDDKGTCTHLIGSVHDITERKQADDLLRQSEEKYRTILENMHEGYFEVDLAGNFTFFNDSLCRISGYSQEELLGMNDRQYTNKETSKKVFQTFNKVFNTGEPTEGFDWQIIRKDGTKKYVEASVSLQKDSSDKPKGFRGIARDITERKQAESQREAALEALRESEYKYKSLIENIPGIILTIDLEGKITFVSKRTNEILGYEDSEMINMAIFNFIPEEDHQRAVERLQKGMKGEKIKHFQMPVTAKSGEKLFFDFSFTRIYKDGAVVGAQGTAVDITERKHAESQWEAALEALRLSEKNFRHSLEDLPLGVRIVTIEGETIYANQAILDIYGYASMEELKTTPVENRYTPESFAEYKIRREKRKRGDDAPSEYDIDILRKDGEVRHLHVFRKDVLWNGERQFQVLYSDITNRKQAEERIHASLREKDILLSEVHHRVKNNMQVISGLLALQARSAGNPELTGKLNESQSRIRSMVMIHEKLYNSKDFTRIDLAGYVRSLSEELFQSYKISPGKIYLIIQTDGDVYVDINKAIPCGLILNELISNALKHAFPEDRHGELQIIIRETKNTEIEIVVRDNGLGLPDDVDIFQPLSVGLHLMNGLVKNQLDGQMEVRRDSGTEIRIKFPL